MDIDKEREFSAFVKNSDFLRSCLDEFYKQAYMFGQTTEGHHYEAVQRVRREIMDLLSARAQLSPAPSELTEQEIISIAKNAGFTFTEIMSRPPEIFTGNHEAHDRLLRFAYAIAARAQEKA